jgi:hypothetical protein
MGLLLIINMPAVALDWYRSDAAGNALERMPSESSAKQNRYSLSIEKTTASLLPAAMQPYYQPNYQIELHITYEQGAVSGQQWQCSDSAGIRLIGAASTGTALDSIELYDGAGFLTEEYRFPGGAETVTRYFYNHDLLIRAETHAGDTAITTDYYRYSRSNALRYLERQYHTTVEAPLILSFPYRGSMISTEEQFIIPIIAVSSDFLSDVLNSDAEADTRTVYTTDSLGRIVTETRYDKDGAVTGKLENIWVDNRLKSMLWHAGDDDRRTDYEYDEAGARITEKNYNRGALERVVRRAPGTLDRDIEELYLNGKVVLRALWEHGHKISEERVP